MRLGLGTVQFGINYGITNPEGKTSIQEVKKILEHARGIGIDVLDTAPSYGESESVLGNFSLNKFNTVTKTAPIKNQVINEHDIENVEKAFVNSLEKLNMGAIYGLIVHQTSDMNKKGSEKLYEKLLHLKDKGLVKKIGVSVYEQSEIDSIFSRYNFDLIQIPINVFDQRLLKNDTLSKLKEKNIEIHARSILLQGILVSEAHSLPSQFNNARHLLAQYHEDLQSKGLSKLEGALQFINERTEIDYAILGVNSLSQLKEIYRSYLCVQSRKDALIDYSKYEIHDEQIIDPRKW